MKKETMATRKTNPALVKAAAGNGAGGGIDTQMVLSQAEQVAATAGTIARLNEEVSEGADAQLRSLDRALASVNEMAASLTQTAGQAESVSVSAEQLGSSVNEMAASIEQVTANTASLAASVRETAQA